MKKYKFYKEPNGDWFIDLPDWKGTKSDLQMVSGADTMLEMMAEGKDVVKAYISEKPFEGSDELQLVNDHWVFGAGADYILNKYRGIDLNLKIWLCDVTKYVFGFYPKKIYIASITE